MARLRMRIRGRFILGIDMTLLLPVAILALPVSVIGQAYHPEPPTKTVKLVFIHHSCGENWLADNNGGLGRKLAQNNYFVSDTNYGWGPDSIGDRTDITNWPEWFTGPNHERYLEALYTTSERSSPYGRNLPDPGGENEIIMLKSCFPNSNLAGSPADPAARGEGLTVSNAKWIYKQLLNYFATRPDKLFIAITAPPVQDPTYAANARSFNTWLVRDWLKDYGGNNVAVFDFYNVLTDPRNHHRYQKGAIEYVTDRGKNTLYYPTDGDDHPSPGGNRKATQEFVPLLNAYYHSWKESQPVLPPPKSHARSLPPPAQHQRPSERTTAGAVIDDFETEADKWTAFLDEGKDTQLVYGRDKETCHGGTFGLCIDYDIARDSWATCSLVYSSHRDWSAQQGLTAYLHGERVGQKLLIVAYQGEPPDNLMHFEFQAEINEEGVRDWQRVDILWDQFLQPAWQGDSTVHFDPTRAIGVAFAFQATEGQRNAGKLWVDDLTFQSAQNR